MHRTAVYNNLFTGEIQKVTQVISAEMVILLEHYVVISDVLLM